MLLLSLWLPVFVHHSLGHKVVQSHHVLDCCKKNYLLAEDKFPTLDTHAFKLRSIFQMSLLFQTANYRLCLSHYNEKASNKLFFCHKLLISTLPFEDIKKKIRWIRTEPSGTKWCQFQSSALEYLILAQSSTCRCNNYYFYYLNIYFVMTINTAHTHTPSEIPSGWGSLKFIF